VLVSPASVIGAVPNVRLSSGARRQRAFRPGALSRHLLQADVSRGCNPVRYVLRSRRGDTHLPRGTTAGIQAKHASRLRLILGRLHVAVEARDMALPGLDLHPLKGERKGSWTVRVSGNWRVTFTMSGSDVEDVDYEDYH
jgi:proteic killer suppression protein